MLSFSLLTAAHYVIRVDGIRGMLKTCVMSSPSQRHACSQVVVAVEFCFHAALSPVTKQSFSIGSYLTHNNNLMALYPGQPWWAGIITLRNINPLYYLSLRALPTFHARPPILGSNAKENPEETAERNMKNPRTGTYASFILA